MATRQLELIVRERSKSGTMTISEVLAPLRPPERNGWLSCSFTPGPSADHLFLQPSLRCPDRSHPISTHILINCCTRLDRVGLAFVLLRRFPKVGLGADPDVFNPLVKGLCKDNRIPEAAAIVLDKRPKLGCTHNLYSYSTPMNRLCKMGQIEKAEELLNYMGYKGLQLNVVAYTTLMDALCKKGEIERAKELLHHMISKGHMPNVVTYSTIMNALCKQGETKREAHTYEEQSAGLGYGSEHLSHALHLPGMLNDIYVSVSLRALEFSLVVQIHAI